MADNPRRSPEAQPLILNESQTTEQRMRRALGLNTTGKSGPPVVHQQRADQARARHRFVQDGGVPVTVLNHRTDEVAALKERLTEVQAALEAERAAHGVTRRLVTEHQAASQALQTRLAHADLAHRESLQQERLALVAAQEALAAAQQARRPRAIQVVEPDPAPETTPLAAPRLRGRPRTAPPKEAKPVRWWTPSFRAKVKN